MAGVIVFCKIYLLASGGYRVACAQFKHGSSSTIRTGFSNSTNVAATVQCQESSSLYFSVSFQGEVLSQAKLMADVT